MIPKGKLLALVLIFGAVGTLAATGAFTTVEAERTADVDVAGDANALLAIQPTEENGSSSFIQQDNTTDSTFEIVLEGDGGNNGVNANATTTAQNIFNITNNGQEDVDVWIATEGGAQQDNASVNTTFYIDDNNVGSEVNTTGNGTVNITQRVDEYDALVDNGDVVISESVAPDSVSEVPNSTDEIAVNIDSGQTVTVSMAVEIENTSQIDLSDSDEPILEDITILAVNDNENDRDIQEGTTTGSGS